MKGSDGPVVGEQTPVTLGVLGFLLTALVGGVFFVANVNSNATQAREEVRALKDDTSKRQDEYVRTVQQISVDIAEIKGELKRRRWTSGHAE